MIILKIKEVGHSVEIPGLPITRSPVDIDISKVDLRLVLMYLKNAGISNYDIVSGVKPPKKVERKAKPPIKKIKEKSNDSTNIDDRFNRIERMLVKLSKKTMGNTDPNKEQIINKLNELDKKIDEVQPATFIHKSSVKGEPDIEEFEAFIPDIDVSDMKLTSSDSIQKIKQDDDLEDTADILAGLMKKN